MPRLSFLVEIWYTDLGLDSVFICTPISAHFIYNYTLSAHPLEGMTLYSWFGSLEHKSAALVRSFVTYTNKKTRISANTKTCVAAGYNALEIPDNMLQRHSVGEQWQRWQSQCLHDHGICRTILNINISQKDVREDQIFLTACRPFEIEYCQTLFICR